MEYPISKLLVGKKEKHFRVEITEADKFKSDFYFVEHEVVLRIKLQADYTEENVRSIGELIASKLDEFDSFKLDTTLLNSEEIAFLLEDLILSISPINLYNSDFATVTKYIENEELSGELDLASKLAYAYNVSRILNHLPHNFINPDYMAREIPELFVGYDNVKTTVLRRSELEEQGFTGHLSVSQGSLMEPALIKIEYVSDPSLKKVALVGKGMTFDIGGYNIKVQRDLRSMKKDMAGANGVVGAMLNMVSTGQKANVTAYLCVTDNLINSNAALPGDIVAYKNGVNVEIINTDAEGRMVLADGLIAAEDDGNEIIIDICTLTGAIVNAIGNAGAGLFVKDRETALQVEEISHKTTEKTFMMPYISEYDERLKSDVADICHLVVEGGAGSIIAALFLDHFVKEATHIHIDMAAMSDKEYLGVKSNGYGNRLLTKLVAEL